MCVIVHNKAGSRNLTKQEFDKCWNSNSDGFWVMYAKDSQLIIEKSLLQKESYELYLKAMAEAEWGNVISHWRFKTHWPVSIENVHPFICWMDSSGGSMGLVHNGILAYTSKDNPTWSDTRILAHALTRFPRDYHKMEEYQEMINKQLSWDKVLIMDSTWHVEYFGAKWVTVDEGIWASNWCPIIYNMQQLAKKWVNINWAPYDFGKFWKIPSKKDETSISYFHDWILYFDEFFVNEKGIVCEYEEFEDITVSK